MSKVKLGRLTDKMLEQRGACRGQLRIFRQLFPKGFVPSRENFLKAAKRLNLLWAAGVFLSDDTVCEMRDRTHMRRCVFSTHMRRWSVFSLGYLEPYGESLAVVWWEMIQEQIDF